MKPITDEDIQYPVEDTFPPGATSILALREQGFREDEAAVVMRNRDDDGALYILLNDPINGRRWIPVRIDA
jgi:hypothetical protein